MVIVEDSFVEVQYKRSHDWLLNDDQENSQRSLNNSRDNGGDGEDGGNGDKLKALPPPPITLPQFLISDQDEHQVKVARILGDRKSKLTLIKEPKRRDSYVVRGLT
jgi:hypothetical protein